MVSPTVLNIEVDALLRAVLMKVCIPQEAQHGLIWVVGEYIILFSAENSRIVGCNTIWVQTTLTLVV